MEHTFHTFCGYIKPIEWRVQKQLRRLHRWTRSKIREGGGVFFREGRGVNFSCQGGVTSPPQLNTKFAWGDPFKAMLLSFDYVPVGKVVQWGPDLVYPDLVDCRDLVD